MIFLQHAPQSIQENMNGGDVFFFYHLKFNIAPEDIPSQKESSLPTIIFQGLC